MKSFFSFYKCNHDAEIKSSPTDVAAWVRLIADEFAKGKLSSHASALVVAHDLFPKGHAVHAFADKILLRCSEQLRVYSEDPKANVEGVIDEFVKWKSALQCGHTHDVSKGYFIDAEPFMDQQWDKIIHPLIENLCFTRVLDLACGHGRNSEKLRMLSPEIHLVDINQSCIDACRERFAGNTDTLFHYHVTDGNHLGMISDDCISLVYSWDSMVHFDKLIVRDYMSDIARVLRPGGHAFLHHSNFGDKAPDSNWANNVGTRSDMSAEIMCNYSADVGLDIIMQKIQGRAEGWGEDGLDCVSILRKPDLKSC